MIEIVFGKTVFGVKRWLACHSATRVKGESLRLSLSGYSVEGKLFSARSLALPDSHIEMVVTKWPK